MNKVWVIICLCIGVLAGCKKADDPAVINSNQRTIDQQVIANYISVNNLTGMQKLNPTGTDTTDIMYQVVQQGTVSSIFTNSTQITVGYTAKWVNSSGVGTQFQKTDTYHPSFVLSQVIKGWQLVLQKGVVNKDGTVRILIPSRYAYGPYAQPDIGLPANAVLDFTINLYDVTN
jgi:FKBP-type peptidyl-prolyl cis-trans isomerase FkpA